MSQQQASVPVSPLRRRMLDDRAIRSLHEDTQRNYIKSVRNFAAFLGRSPETATPEDVRRFQIHQADSGVQPPTVNNAMSGLRFLLNVTLDRPDLSRRLVLVRYAQKLPTVLNVEDAGRLLEAARGHRRFHVGAPSRPTKEPRKVTPTRDSTVSVGSVGLPTDLGRTS